MYDFNPFREIKKLMQEGSTFSGSKNQPSNPNTKMVKAPLLKKRKYFEDLVKKGEMTQAEFDRYDRLGEFEGAVFADTGEPDGNSVREGNFEDFEDCIEFYMDAKDLSREAARSECHNGRHTFSEAAEREYDDFDLGPQVEEMPGAEEYEAKQENDKHEGMIKDKLLAFLNQKPHDHVTKRVHGEIHRARVYSNPHEQDSSVVRVAGQTFIVPHGHSPHIKVVS